MRADVKVWKEAERREEKNSHFGLHTSYTLLCFIFLPSYEIRSITFLFLQGKK
jgi:hypothetical protein